MKKLIVYKMFDSISNINSQIQKLIKHKESARKNITLIIEIYLIFNFEKIKN